MKYAIKPIKNNNPPTMLDILGACVLGAVIGTIFTYGIMGAL
jgi:Na+-transporting NADH:ubiquinone oxidoreductase subunit NqrD